MKTEIRKRLYPHYKFPDEIEISIEKMSAEDCKWFGVDLKSYCFKTTNYGWFPIGDLMGVIKGRFEDTNNLGATIKGNMGTASIAIIEKDKAIEILKKAGFKIIN